MTTHKDIDPRGFLLNDNDTGVDHLGKSTFADAIADSLHHVETPITIGLYGKWGSGKSFLLRHIENILKRFQKQQEINDKRKKGQMEREFRWKHVCRAVCWGLTILFIFSMLFVTVLLAVKPWLITDWLGMKLPDPEKAENSNVTAPNAPAMNPEEENLLILKRLRIFGLVLVPIELVLVFFVGCFGKRWLSVGYYGSCALLTYGAFTKLLLRNTDTNIVEDPGESPATVLKHIKHGDKRLAMSVSEASNLPRKYIFVDFKAWEYAGSDTLWAAIVTKIADAVEQEFGMITARLFRMLKIEQIKSSIRNKYSRTIYLQLEGQKNEVMDMVCQYGAIKLCKELSKNKWQIEFCNDGECRRAKECLEIEGVCCTDKPISQDQPSEENSGLSGSAQESTRRLIPKNDSRKKDSSNSDGRELGLWSSPPKGLPCARFCCHFLKYPTKILCLPRLVWWILIFLCAVATPFIAYAIAQYFGLDVYRTYREVPLYGQVLLWLPAGAAVTSVMVNFVWAMCHSQRRRINAALDGTKTKMAEQLGFMSKVKNEIEVVSKLIHCARFTHQKDYKIVITIDDLDRIPLKQVQSVLEAVHILLSDISAPFICLVAVDSRVVVKCIEESMGEVMKESHITGHEYLKKIINLPICLPEINDSNKKRFIAGLIDQADGVVTYRTKVEKQIHSGNAGRANGVARPGSNSRAETGIVDVDGGMETIPKELDDEDSHDGFEDTDLNTNGAKTTDGIFPQVQVDGSRRYKMDQSNTHVSANGLQTTQADVHKVREETDSNGNLTGIRYDSTDSAKSAQRYKPSVIKNCAGHEDIEMTPVSHSSWSPTTEMRQQNNRNMEEERHQPQKTELDHKEFLFQCRSYIYENKDLHKHIHGNARNIKRLFNIISLTASLINSFLKKQRRRHFIQSHSNGRNESHCADEIHRTAELAKNLVMWVILTDQWPYRSSYILQVIDDAEQRYNAGLRSEEIPETWTILEIYENKVKKECVEGEAWLRSLDGDPDLFFSYLQLLEKEHFTASKILKFQSYTVNLDFSIRHAIAFTRDISALSASRRCLSSPYSVEKKSDEGESDNDEKAPALGGQENVRKYPYEIQLKSEKRPYSWHVMQQALEIV